MSVVSQIERRFSPASDINFAMSSSEVMARLAKDKPLFHYLDEQGVQRAAKVGAKLKAGDWSIAVTPKVMKWIGDHVNDSMRTIETGAGYTTVLLGAIAREHYCCTFMSREVEKISAYI
jgi:butyrate kinase